MSAPLRATRPVALLLPCLLGLPSELPAAAAPPPQGSTGPPPVRVVCHFDDPEFASHARAVVAEVWQQVRPWLPPARGRATLHVHNDVTGCQAVAGRFGVATTPDVPGVVDAERAVGHVFFWRSGWCRDARWRIANLTMCLLLDRAIACPAAEQPAWLRSGLAQWAEAPHRSERGWVEERALLGSPSIVTVRRMLAQARMPAVAEVLHGRTTLGAPELAAVHRIVMLFLMARHGDATRAALRAAATAADRDAVVTAVVAGLRRQLGEAGWSELDAELAGWIAEQPQTIDVEQFPPYDAVGAPGGAGFVPASPSAMWLDDNRKSDFTLTARPQLLQTGQGDLVFERKGGRWIRVTLVAHGDHGTVYVLERQLDDGAQTGWKVLARSEGDVPSIRLGRPIELHLRAGRRRLEVSVAGRSVLTAELPGSLAGRFGVGGPFGNHVAWRGVRVR